MNEQQKPLMCTVTFLYYRDTLFQEHLQLKCVSLLMRNMSYQVHVLCRYLAVMVFYDIFSLDYILKKDLKK